MRGEDDFLTAMGKGFQTDSYENPRELTSTTVEDIKYTGSTEAGTEVSASDITATIIETYDTGVATGIKHNNTNFTLKEGVTLVAGETSTVTIVCAGKEYPLKITCTTKTQAQIDAEKKAQEEAEANQYNTGITYDQLARTPDSYIGKKVKFSGKVIQVIEDGSGETALRLAVNSDYDTILYCTYPDSITSSRVLEDDKITIYGISLGTITYESTMGANITIPAVDVEKIER